MALARAHVWNAGDLLTANDLNGEFNNILNNPISLISPTTAAITFTTAQTFPTNQLLSTGVIGGQALLGSTAGTVVLGAPGGSRVLNLAGVVTSGQTASYTASQYQVQTTDGKGAFVVTTTAMININVGTAGPAAGGRDTAAVFSSTFAYNYAITTGLGSTSVAGIASTTPPPGGPVLPSGYQAWAFLSASPYSSASTSYSANQQVHGEWTHFTNLQDLLTSGDATSETNVDYSASVPAIAGNLQCRMRHIGQSAAAGTLVESEGHIRLVSGSDYYIQRQRIGAPGGNDIETNASFIMPVTSSQGFLYHNVIVVGTSGRSSVQLQGYTNPNGGF